MYSGSSSILLYTETALLYPASLVTTATLPLSAMDASMIGEGTVRSSSLVSVLVTE